MAGYFTPMGLSLAARIRNSRSLYRPIKRIADKYADVCGYRQHGLKYDDLIIEENEAVQTVSARPDQTRPDQTRMEKVAVQTLILHSPSSAAVSSPCSCLRLPQFLLIQALKRLTPREEYDRAYRLRVASQLSVLHHPLPKEQQLTPEQVHAPILIDYAQGSLFHAETRGISCARLQDQRYLTPLIEQIVTAEDERAMLDTAVINKPKRMP
ncbi:MAG: Cytochrome b-c1 complex subunit 7 [Cyphobasidiales sp. Tagirdzhanova-0007]|nr:MAG: Cytochrome b-c1 complex subunit 7 [Cyphobasidiales sp. Tagirdzhanova-0007]